MFSPNRLLLFAQGGGSAITVVLGTITEPADVMGSDTGVIHVLGTITEPVDAIQAVRAGDLIAVLNTITEPSEFPQTMTASKVPTALTITEPNEVMLAMTVSGGTPVSEEGEGGLSGDHLVTIQGWAVR